MELLAVIRGLEALKKDGLDVTIYSDSKYVVDSFSKGWVFSWYKKPNFGNKKNPDLWIRFLELQKKHRVSFVWVKGHAENYFNNLCDKLATQAADNGPYLKDIGYRNESGLF
jgi:ribonuclease HI